MDMQKSKANSNRRHTDGGFSAIELIITATVLSIVTGLGIMGITRARASVRLSGAAREYASHIEKARMFSIRRHADDAAERASVSINADQSSYDVTMDLDGDGGMDTRTIPLPSGVTFKTVEAIAFDWRGRTWNTVGGVTSANAQVSITLENDIEETVSVDVTGSGDITIDSQVFEDSLPNVNLNVGDLASGATPVATPVSESTPTPSPEAVGTPDNTTNPDPSPTPPVEDGGGVISEPTPTPSATATPTPTPTATPHPTPAASPAATPTPAVCTISTDAATLLLNWDGTKTIKVSHNLTTGVAITARVRRDSSRNASI